MEGPEFWIDVGGTFTDCLARMPDGSVRRHKTLSSGLVQGVIDPSSSGRELFDSRLRRQAAGIYRGFELRLLAAEDEVPFSTTVVDFQPERGQLLLADELPPNAIAAEARYALSTGEHAPIVAIRHLLSLSADDPIGDVTVKLGTTRGTNALLTRSGARVGLLVTEGFADGLEIGYQDRPRLFERNIRKPSLLYERVAEVHERLAADGAVLQPLDEDHLRAICGQWREAGVEAVAICLLHSYANPIHEVRAAEIAADSGFPQISVSHETARTLGWIARSETTVVDAYLSPVLSAYLSEIRAALGPGSRLQVLTSAGELVSENAFRGKDSVLSGPAGGVVGFSTAAETAGFRRAIGFDMGGTSTDVSRYDGYFDRQYETEKAGVRIVAPMMAIETVAAGGGSVCGFDGVKLTVGPQSAGADPGPACYGRGGPLTVTDINLLLGKLQASHLPFALDEQAAQAELTALCARLKEAGFDRQPLEVAEGLLHIANNNIVQAIRSVSVAKGVAPREYLLAAFGGAAGQHACAVAEALGMTHVLLHPDAGVLSAWGIGAAQAAQYVEAAVYRPLRECHHDLVACRNALADEAQEKLRQDHRQIERVTTQVELELRYAATQSSLVLRDPTLDDVERLQGEFESAHEERYGYRRELPIEVVKLRVTALVATDRAPPKSTHLPDRPATATGRVSVRFGGENREATVYQRDGLEPGHVVVGPALIAEQHATTVIDPGWTARRLSGGELLVDQTTTKSVDAESSADERRRQNGERMSIPIKVADPVYLEILHNHFAAIADQMGIVLRDTAVSVNVKERLDFSCALFTATGDLIANAPHVPVHLGAMSETVRAIKSAFPDMSPGDAFISNDPYRGGSHLPDITVVSPLFLGGRSEPTFFVANRAHHAEIGGMVPGSMPPNSRVLADEGALLSNLQLAERGAVHWDLIRETLLRPPHPTRNVEDNLADIAAQLSANHRGIAGVESMVHRYGDDVVVHYAQHVLDASAKKMRRALARLTPGVRRFRDSLDNGAEIHVSVDCRGESVTLDFTGTSPVLDGNLNANRAITTAAIMYCMRLLLDEDVPLNQGVLEPVEMILPHCFLNPTPNKEDPQQSPAVAGGNVETSQRIVDVVLGAFQLAAASQGTMNNLTFGDDTFGYYETIGGGEGATSEGPGASAVHTHMTNTRLTDPEVFEFRLPVRLRTFAIRRGSGGRGRHRGGDGLIREIQFLRPLHVALLTNRRAPYQPYGLAGGEPGQSGESCWIRPHRKPSTVSLAAVAQWDVEPGDSLRIGTPGGGGWGELTPDSDPEH